MRLFVSNDNGRNWLMYQQRQPHEGRFDFQASRDGEYWFIVRTNFDGDTRANTRGQKVVIVDRTPPYSRFRPKSAATARLLPRGVPQTPTWNLEPCIEYRTADRYPFGNR